MATSTTQKKPCSKCDKGSGIFTCDGCQQSFCRKHSDEHRQELATQIDIIGQEHDVLQRDINKEVNAHPLFSRIDVWEQESINKIHQVAEKARADLKQLIDQTKQDVRTTMNELMDELQSSRQSEDYTELDLKKWINQLNAIRQELEQSIDTYFLDDNDHRSIIRLIKVKNSQELRSVKQSIPTHRQTSLINQNSTSDNREKFNKRDDQITLSGNDLVATYLGSESRRPAFVLGVNHYATGMHHIRFRIEKKDRPSFAFGIISSSDIKLSSISSSTTLNGWRPGIFTFVNGTIKLTLSSTSIQIDDTVTLALDCGQKRIYLKCTPAKLTLELPIDTEKCPLPWRVIVGLYDTGDCVRIVH